MGDPISMAAISATFQVLFEKVLNTLSTYTHHEYRSLLGGDDQGVNQALAKLEDTLIKFQKMIRDDELKIFKNKETRDWYGSVRSAVNEAEIILEDHLQSDSDDRHHQRVCNPFPTLFEFSVRKLNKFGERIASLIQKFDSLEVRRVQLNFDEIDLILNRETMSTLSEVVFGRNDEKEHIVKFLLSDANTQSDNGPRIYAIIGLGGIGKTTLARLIYNDKNVVENFESVIWVWVSQIFDVKKLMEKIIETKSGDTRKFESLETTQNHLKSLLSGKKFLLVLDDVWNEKQEEWEKLKAPLNFGAFGSSILLTTRGADVALTARAHDQHKIAVLSEDQCWKVFKESAFLEEKEENGKLEVIGKQIARKCGGLPLAAKSLGGSLRLIREIRVWETTRDSDIWELPEPCDILPALKLSLDRLESHSRDCFAFCCVFRKGYEMHKNELIELWMANDLFPSHKILEPEDVGNQIFNELVLKSFFEISVEYGDVKMHDLMHDLAFSFGNKGFSWVEEQDVSKIPSGVLHLSWYSRSISFSHPSKTKNLHTLSKLLPSLRTLILVDRSGQFEFPTEINFKNHDYLQALRLSWNKIHNLPASIGKIKHLKYLSLFGCTGVTQIPDSICSLTSLQTLQLIDLLKLTQLPERIGQLVHLRNLYLSNCHELTHLPDATAGLINLRCLDLRYCFALTHLPDGMAGIVNLWHLGLMENRELKQLPDGISQLLNLEHLYISSCPKLTQLPNRIGKLVNLRTLGLFVVDDRQRITELQGMNQLTGSLEIRGLEHVRDTGEAESAFLRNKKNLFALELIWEDSHVSNSSSDVAKAESVLEALQPPQSLNRELIIRGYGGSLFPSWMGFLEKLVRIVLKDCTKCEHLPPLAQLPLLKFLVISGMRSLECIGTELYGSNNSSVERCVIFPSLIRLEFDDMPNLKEWLDLEIMNNNQQTDPCPCLEKLTLLKCPKLISLPSLLLSFVQKLKIQDCDKVIIRSLSCLTSLWLDGEATNGVTSFPSASLQNLDALESLEICDYSELTSLPDKLSSIASLKRLEVKRCPALQSVPVMRSAIVEQRIHECQSLKSLSQSLQYLSTLKSLVVHNCDQLELSSEDFQGLISLQTLSIIHLPKLTSLPHLQNLSTLKILVVWECNNLIRLWPNDENNLTGLYSLKSLQIGHCKKLMVLPPGLQNLTSLQEFLIQECHRELHSRCDRDTGEYWPSITHSRTLHQDQGFQHLTKLQSIELSQTVQIEIRGRATTSSFP